MILLNDFRRQWSAVKQDVLAAVAGVGANGWYILGEELKAFERELADLFGQSHAVGVANGMDAIEIALRVLGLNAGERVLTTPLSAFATTLAICRAGGVPAYVDVDANGGINLEQCCQALKSDPTLRFLVPVHLYGFPLNLVKLRALKEEFNLVVVEDCAQAIAASFNGEKVGSVGQAAAVSFYPTKNLGAYGDGGALLTNQSEVATHAISLRNYGQSALYEHRELGLNSRLDELQAAILRQALLPRLSGWTEIRRRTAGYYLDKIRNPALRPVRPEELAEPVWHLFPILVEKGSRDAFRVHLKSAGVTTAVHYPQIIPDQPALRGTPAAVLFEAQNARRFCEREVSIPIHPFLRDDEIELIVSAINGWTSSQLE